MKAKQIGRHCAGLSLGEDAWKARRLCTATLTCASPKDAVYKEVRRRVSGKRQLPHRPQRPISKRVIDRRFPTALQVMQSLVLLEREGRPSVSSAEFAAYFRVNATLMRRLLTTLVQHGLLISQMGRHGGVRLARKPDQITLRDIYQAAVAEKKLWTPRAGIPQRCVVSRNFEHYFGSLERDADLALTDLLGQRTLAQSFAQVEDLDELRVRTSKGDAGQAVAAGSRESSSVVA